MERKDTVERSSRKGVVSVLATVLVAVGALFAMAGFVAESSPEQFPTAVSVGGAVPIAVAPSSDRGGQVPDERAVRDPVPPSEVTVPMRVRMKRQLGDSTSHYTGPIVVEVAGRVLTSTTLVNRDALTLEVPANATSLRFVAPDHVPLEEPLPLKIAAGRKDPEAVLQPDAKLVVRSLGLPRGGESSLQFGVDGDSGWSNSCEIQDDERDVALPFPVGEEFHWWAELICGKRLVSVSGHEAALRRGERRFLTLDFASVPMQCYRVVGPSPELMAALRVYRQVNGSTDQPRLLELDSSGCFEVPRDGGGKWCVRAGRLREVELAEEPHAEAILLRPSVPLLGLGLQRDGAAPQQTWVSAADGELLDEPALLHVLARDRLPPTLKISGTDGSAEIRCDCLPRDDVVWVKPQAEPPMGRLLLTLRGPAPSVEVAAQLRIEIDADGHAPDREGAVEDMPLDVPADVSFGVRWTLGNRPGPWIAQNLRVASGDTKEIVAEWPVAQRWTGEVEKFTAMPPERRWHRVTWGDGPWFGQWAHQLADDGRFDLFLFADETLDPIWNVDRATTPVRAQVEVADPVRRHLVVRPLAEVRWVNVVVDAKPPWMVFVWGNHEPRFRPGSWHNEQRPIPVLAGEVCHGGLLSGAKLLAWFRIDAQGDTVHVRPRDGRTIELRPRTECGNRMVCLVGPGGQWDKGEDLSSTSPVFVFAPDGTRGIVVFDGNHPEGAAREIPLGSDDVIVID